VVIAVLFGVALSTINAPFRRRFKSNASWSAPPYDLRLSRSSENLVEPSAIIRRDVVLLLTGMVFAIVLAAVEWYRRHSHCLD